MIIKGIAGIAALVVAGSLMGSQTQLYTQVTQKVQQIEQIMSWGVAEAARIAPQGMEIN